MLSIKDCGIMLEPQLGMSMAELIGAAKLTEKLGFGYLFRSDHLLPTDDRRGLDSPECWTSLGAVAASTDTLKFGPMVTPIGFRNPALLARMACTVHSFSRGRLQLAVGAGWYEAEYMAHGYRFPPFKERMAQFHEALKIITAMVQDGRADFDGAYFSAHTDCLPRPSGKMRTIIGGKSKPLVRAAARVADEWNVFLSPTDAYLELKKTLDAEVDGRQVTISETGPYLIGRNAAELEENAKLQAAKLGWDLSPREVLKRLGARNAPCGTAEEFVDKLRSKMDVGIERFYFQTLVPQNTAMVGLLADTLKRGV